MKIQTNTAANSALGYMKVNAQNTERSIQKLSSGFRINRAADDAAGLAIANQLRADSKTLGQAQKNAAQASAMLQIADGAAGTLGNIFDRMRELASQGASANIGGQGSKLQDEWNALYSEADRLISGTKYQGTNVLTGLTAGAGVAGTAGAFSGANITAASGVPASMTDGTYTLVDGTGASAGQLEIRDSSNNVVATSTGSGAATGGAGSITFDNGVTLTKGAGYTAPTALVAAAAGTASNISDATKVTGVTNTTQNASENATGLTFALNSNGTDIDLMDGATIIGTVTAAAIGTGSTTVSFGNYDVALGSLTAATDLVGESFDFGGATAGSPAAASNANSSTFDITGATTPAAPSILVGTSASQATGTLAQRAAIYDSADSITLSLGSLDDMDIKNLSSSVNVGVGAAATGASLLTTSGAKDALARLDLAQSKLNTFVGKLGAAQSRVDYAAQNVDSMLQNTQAAESSIRDADMAKEMSAFTKNNILQQAAQSMLSQANQGTQGILQLLRG